MVRFLRGNFIPIDGFALQDFEATSVGDIVDTPFTFIGEVDNNDCSMEPAAFIQRV